MPLPFQTVPPPGSPRGPACGGSAGALGTLLWERTSYEPGSDGAWEVEGRCGDAAVGPGRHLQFVDPRRQQLSFCTALLGCFSRLGQQRVGNDPARFGPLEECLETLDLCCEGLIFRPVGEYRRTIIYETLAPRRPVLGDPSLRESHLGKQLCDSHLNASAET